MSSCIEQHSKFKAESDEERDSLEESVRLLGEHLHFNGGLKKEHQFKVEKNAKDILYGDVIYIKPVKSNIPFPDFTSTGSFGQERNLKVKVEENGYRILLRGEDLNNLFHYFLYKK